MYSYLTVPEYNQAERDVQAWRDKSTEFINRFTPTNIKCLNCSKHKDKVCNYTFYRRY